MARRKSRDRSTSNTSRTLIQNLDINPTLKFRVEEAYKGIRANIMF